MFGTRLLHSPAARNVAACQHVTERDARCTNGERSHGRTGATDRALRRILVRQDLAQEALQDVYVSIWRNAKEYRPARAAAFTWMLSIARYRAIDIKRSRKREVLFADPAEYVPEDASTMDADLALIADRNNDARRLRDCLKELSTPQRNAVCLAYMNGLTHEEVAGTLAAPLGTVKSWVRRGLESLKRCIQP
ncbi:MAG: sigma-70 family RNA polymerase sigma factor [Gammaproteobacteria bacterium]